jgi:hypothetical protein
MNVFPGLARVLVAAGGAADGPDRRRYLALKAFS